MNIWRDLLTCPECGHVQGLDDSEGSEGLSEVTEESKDQDQEDSCSSKEDITSQKSSTQKGTLQASMLREGLSMETYRYPLYSSGQGLGYRRGSVRKLKQGK